MRLWQQGRDIRTFWALSEAVWTGDLELISGGAVWGRSGSTGSNCDGRAGVAGWH